MYLDSCVCYWTIPQDQEIEPTKLLVKRWIDNENVTRIYNGILCSQKEKQNHDIFGKMDWN